MLTATCMFSESGNPYALYRLIPGVTGSRKFKIAATKPEILISPLQDKIATKFQRITEVQQLNGSSGNNVRLNRKWKIQDCGLQSGNVGRHIGFSTSGLVAQYSNQSH